MLWRMLWLLCSEWTLSLLFFSVRLSSKSCSWFFEFFGMSQSHPLCWFSYRWPRWVIFSSFLSSVFQVAYRYLGMCVAFLLFPEYSTSCPSISSVYVQSLFHMLFRCNMQNSSWSILYPDSLRWIPKFSFARRSPMCSLRDCGRWVVLSFSSLYSSFFLLVPSRSYNFYRTSLTPSLPSSAMNTASDKPMDLTIICLSQPSVLREDRMLARYLPFILRWRIHPTRNWSSIAFSREINSFLTLLVFQACFSQMLLSLFVSFILPFLIVRKWHYRMSVWLKKCLIMHLHLPISRLYLPNQIRQPDGQWSFWLSRLVSSIWQ